MIKKMKTGITLGALLCLLQLAAASTAHAEIWEDNRCNPIGFRSYFDFDIGYRWDRFGVQTIEWGSTVFSSHMNQDIRHVDSIQFGLSGIWNPLCSNAYVRGEGHYSRVLGHNGHYHEDTFVVTDTVSRAREVFTGHVHGHAWDFNLGLGYFFDINDCWGFAPVVGWAYDKMDWNIRRVSDQFGVNQPRIKKHNRLNGAFVGLDSLFSLNPCTQVVLGYELHWRAWREFEDAPTNFIQRMKDNDIWGHRFRAEVDWTFCQCWNIGLEFKYQLYRSVGLTGKWNATDIRNAGTIMDRSTNLPGVEEHIVSDMMWDSFSALFKIGFSF